MKALALDTQLVIRTQARRMLSATAEATGCRIIVPATAAWLATHVYHFTVTKYLRTRTVHTLAAKGEPATEKEIATRVAPLVKQAVVGFAKWLENENRRNDSIIKTPTAPPSAEDLAIELSTSGVIRDPGDTRWNIGEDPYVVAEALASGAHWIASENLVRISRGEMERWLDNEQAEGRYHHVPRPFILSPDEAIDTMLDQAESGPSQAADASTTGTTLIAHAVTAPRRNAPAHLRIAILDRFANDLIADGLGDTGNRIRKETEAMQLALQYQEATVVNHRIETMTKVFPTHAVARTRNAEDRRLILEGTRPGPCPGPKPGSPTKRRGHRG